MANQDVPNDELDSEDEFSEEDLEGLTEEQRSQIETYGALIGDLDMTMEELFVGALVELIEKETGKPAGAKCDPNDPPPRIPKWFMDAAMNL